MSGRDKNVRSSAGSGLIDGGSACWMVPRESNEKPVPDSPAIAAWVRCDGLTEHSFGKILHARFYEQLLTEILQYSVIVYSPLLELAPSVPSGRSHGAQIWAGELLPWQTSRSGAFRPCSTLFSFIQQPPNQPTCQTTNPNIYSFTDGEVSNLNGYHANLIEEQKLRVS